MANMHSTVKSLTFSSYNCRGLNSSKYSYIDSILSKCSVLFLQEHWLSDAQLSSLGSISPNISYTGVSGFDNSVMLMGRPYGGCAILWQSNLFVSVTPIDVNSRRLCAARLCSESLKLVLINVYMPYEDSEDNCDEFVDTLAIIEDVIQNNSDCHVVLGGDFNVDFCRDWVHTALLDDFCTESSLMPIIRHTSCNIDYTYHFNMSRFSVLDHFILSGTLFDECVSSALVLHEVDNLSDHDPVMMHLNIDVSLIAGCHRVFTPRVSWVKASDIDLTNYRAALSSNLLSIHLPTAALLCSDLRCTDTSHRSDINHYAEEITTACASSPVQQSSSAMAAHCIPCAQRVRITAQCATT